MLAALRTFFKKRHVLEVDVPIVSRLASVDAHIDLVGAEVLGAPAWLHSSPEYAMKRLLAEGIGDIYQLSHVFRDGELGARHNPEFMMIEWYRVGMSFDHLIEETCDLIRLFVGKRPHEIISYKEAFRRYVGIDPFHAPRAELQKCVPDILCNDREELLHAIMGMKIEPELGKEGLTVLAYYPPSQAALAKTQVVEGETVAERFEIYCEGIELANGYHELQDPQEQLRRLEEANELRRAMGKNTLPIDMRFIKALEKGLPECSGVAVGFDRLMMLRHGERKLEEVMPFIFDVA
jgi:lysyl-tRNA synthetase class 2